MRLYLKINNAAVKAFYRQAFNKQDTWGGYSDAGFDLFCPENIVVPAGQTVWVDLGIACEAFHKKQPTAFYIYPRSSISKTSLRLANSVGIIDSGYRGNLILALDNIKNTSYTIQKGQRLAQICSPKLNAIRFDIVDELSNTKRGKRGFGSTGN